VWSLRRDATRGWEPLQHDIVAVEARRGARARCEARAGGPHVHLGIYDLREHDLTEHPSLVGSCGLEGGHTLAFVPGASAVPPYLEEHGRRRRACDREAEGRLVGIADPRGVGDVRPTAVERRVVAPLLAPPLEKASAVST
jgi:hypothetical protein